DRMKNLAQLSQDGDSIRFRCDSITNLLRTDVKGFTLKKANFRFKNDSLLALALDTARVINVDSVAKALTPRKVHTAMQNALRLAKGNKQLVDERVMNFENEKLKVNRHLMEMHRKFSLPVACLIFFFIGAPLGAIIRKGGLGTPIVISIIFFIFYYVIDTFGAKMAREDVWPVWCGMWLSTGVLAAIGSFLTYKSATDSALFRSEAYGRVADKIKDIIRKRRLAKLKKRRDEGDPMAF
ncbi:MAG: LptF/LptG family permease, partial [Marinilabiliaceae bacterium]